MGPGRGYSSWSGQDPYAEEAVGMATVGAEGPFPPALCLFCCVQNPEVTPLPGREGGVFAHRGDVRLLS